MGNIRFILRALCLLCSLTWAFVQVWWVSRGEKGVEADDPDKEREPQ
ncbi:MAG: hypothetical protein PHX41_00495 [Kiritimatiellae bacterium]|nr:hypothetical protein [Kiritimatiellia bacterium]